jgi:hypothetical protein
MRSTSSTIGYCLTAVFTVLVVRAVTRASAPRWMAYLGYVAAALIATGVVIPLGLDIARLTNFAGYVSWCSWLVAMAIVLWRGQLRADGSTSSPSVRTLLESQRGISRDGPRGRLQGARPSKGRS